MGARYGVEDHALVQRCAAGRAVTAPDPGHRVRKRRGPCEALRLRKVARLAGFDRLDEGWVVDGGNVRPGGVRVEGHRAEFNQAVGPCEVDHEPLFAGGVRGCSIRAVRVIPDRRDLVVPVTPPVESIVPFHHHTMVARDRDR